MAKFIFIYKGLGDLKSVVLICKPHTLLLSHLTNLAFVSEVKVLQLSICPQISTNQIFNATYLYGKHWS